MLPAANCQNSRKARIPISGISTVGSQFLNAALRADLRVSWIGWATAGLLIVLSSKQRGAGVSGSLGQLMRYRTESGFRPILNWLMYSFGLRPS
ncbi:hypothetical protein D3C84_991890 [compost metagenome]